LVAKKSMSFIMKVCQSWRLQSLSIDMILTIEKQSQAYFIA